MARRRRPAWMLEQVRAGLVAIAGAAVEGAADASSLK
jgi:hypothetical protein